MIDKMEDVCLVKIGRRYHKFKWLVGNVYMNCEGVRKEENILKLEYIKAVVWRSLWKIVRNMRSRERQSEIMDWIERSNCDICAINGTGLTGEEYMEVSDGYSWFAANREWTKGRSGGAGFIIKKGIRREEMLNKMEDVCLVKIGRSDHKFEWLVGSVYMNYEGVRKKREHLDVGVHQSSVLESSG